MPLADIADIQISIAELAPALPGQGLALMLADVTTDQADAFDTALTVEVTPAAWQTTLASLEFTSSDLVWVAFSDFFAQAKKPASALLGRRADAVAQVVDIVITGFADGAYVVPIQGVNVTANVVGAAGTGDVQTALIAAIAAATLPAPVEVTGTAVDADTVRITSDNAGVPFTVGTPTAPGDALAVDDGAGVANYGITDDLAAIRAERDDWYALFGDWRTTPEILVAAEYIEPLERIYLAQTADALANTVGASSDVGSLLQALNYMRTSVWYSSNSAQWVEGALLGRMLPEIPGSKSYAGKDLSSVTGETLATTTGLKNKNYGWLETYNAFVPPVASTRHGAMASGDWIDLVLTRDYLAQQLRILAYQISKLDLPYTDIGGSTIRSMVEQRIKDVGEYTGALDLDTLVVTGSTKAQQTSANKLARKWGGTTFEVVATGRVHELAITGTVQP